MVRPGWPAKKASLNSTQLKFIENGSRMAKRIQIQYIKTNQMINVNEIFKKQ